MNRYIRKIVLSVVIFCLGGFFSLQSWGVDNKSIIPGLLMMLSAVILSFDGWRQHRNNKE